LLPVIGWLLVRSLGPQPAIAQRLLGFVIVQEVEHFASVLIDIAAVAALLTVLAFAAGRATAWASAAGARDRFTVGMVFVVRNVGVAPALIACGCTLFMFSGHLEERTCLLLRPTLSRPALIR
jgi:hypothetical protein